MYLLNKRVQPKKVTVIVILPGFIRLYSEMGKIQPLNRNNAIVLFLKIKG